MIYGCFELLTFRLRISECLPPGALMALRIAPEMR
jgi:hypothetical protein